MKSAAEDGGLRPPWCDSSALPPFELERWYEVAAPVRVHVWFRGKRARSGRVKLRRLPWSAQRAFDHCKARVIHESSS